MYDEDEKWAICEDAILAFGCLFTALLVIGGCVGLAYFIRLIAELL